VLTLWKMENEIMKIIKPSVEFFGAVPTEYNAALKFIEMSGRTCYKSEDKITEDSAEGFVQKLIKAGHLAMVEHSSFVVKRSSSEISETATAIIQAGKYLNICGTEDDMLYVGGSLTAWYNRLIELQSIPAKKKYLDMFRPFWTTYGLLFSADDDFDGAFDSAASLPTRWEVCPHDEIPKELHRYSAKFICDRAISHELVRHRPCSFAQESTRYVNYGGKDMEFIEPEGFENWLNLSRGAFEACCIDAQYRYAVMLDQGLKPQQARAVLPNALKTEIVVTADAAEWSHIRKLRTAKAAHPDMQRVMTMMPWEEFL